MDQVVSRCLYCEKKLIGRIDKKFCDDNCRNNHYNRTRKPASRIVTEVNRVLSKNRRLLIDALPEGMDKGKTPRSLLLRKGFSFDYFTHQYINKTGNVYFFCYDYGYLPLEGDWLLIVHRTD